MQQKPVSPRQQQILNLLSEGNSNKDIAFLCNLDTGTVKCYVSRLLKKFNLRNRTELAVKHLKGELV